MATILGIITGDSDHKYPFDKEYIPIDLRLLVWTEEERGPMLQLSIEERYIQLNKEKVVEVQKLLELYIKTLKN